MEREQIIKELEELAKFRTCPEYIKTALALIEAQDEQIFKLENRLKECENGYEGTLFLDRCKLHDAEEKLKELTQLHEMLSESYDHLEQTKDELLAERARLTEENDAWQKRLIAEKEKADKAYYDLACEVEDLRAENETLKTATNDQYAHLCDCHDKIAEMLRQKEADTVRKMHERLKERKVRYGNITFKVVPIDDIDQIAKEMEEGL